MLPYLDQMSACKPVRQMIIQVLAQSDDPAIRKKANDVPTVESILRAATLVPELITRESFNAFIIDHVLSTLRLTPIQREGIKLDV